MNDERCTGTIMTVLGPVEARDMGVALPHEHVLVDFIGAEHVHRGRYDRDAAMEVILPHLTRAGRRGVRTIVECSPSFLGKDPPLLERLSQATGIRFLTNTGYYGGRDGMFLPAYAFRETADQLAERWTNDWLHGLEGTGIRPGFIKTAVNPSGTLSALDRKLLQAAARTHARTGLAIASHTVNAPVFEQLEILRSEGVDPGAFIWVHANTDPDLRRHVAAAQLGAWVEFDGIGEDPGPDIVRITNMKAHGMLDRVLLSHDAGWFEPGRPERAYRGYCDLFDHLIPALKRTGFTDGEITLLTVKNPARAFAIRTRLL